MEECENEVFLSYEPITLLLILVVWPADIMMKCVDFVDTWPKNFEFVKKMTMLNVSVELFVHLQTFINVYFTNKNGIVPYLF